MSYSLRVLRMVAASCCCTIHAGAHPKASFYPLAQPDGEGTQGGNGGAVREPTARVFGTSPFLIQKIWRHYNRQRLVSSKVES